MGYPSFSVGEVLTSSDMNKVGLWRVVPTGATNGTVNADGTVTIGNAVASVTVSGCFGSTYRNYKILVNGSSASADNNLAMTLNGGTTAYYGALIYAGTTGTGPFAAGDNNTAQWNFMSYHTTTSGIITTIELLGPNLAEWTGIQATYITAGSGGTFVGVRQATTQHTGFTFTCGSGTMTGGTITVYGYN